MYSLVRGIHLDPWAISLPSCVTLQNIAQNNSDTGSCTGKTGNLRGGGGVERVAKKNSLLLLGKTQEIWKFCQNTGNCVCPSCKFPDAKGKGYHNICR